MTDDDRDPVSDFAVQAVFIAAGGRCECRDPRCDQGHSDRCARTFLLQHRGDWGDDNAWQLDHVDGDPTNNDPGNLQVLCSACHRYKTGRQR